MIIDEILDRKDGMTYSAKAFYDYVVEGTSDFDVKVARALDCGTNEDIQKVLCEYIDCENYNPLIKDYVMSVEWI